MSRHRIGFMQGRLCPPVHGKIQAFPSADWRAEFPTAQAEGFDVVEWIFEAPRSEENPLWSDAGVAEIQALSQRHSVAVESICADYFMERPFFRGGSAERGASVGVLRRILERAQQVGAAMVEIPMVDASRLKTPQEIEELLAVLKDAAPEARRLGLKITLETDLPPDAFAALLERCPQGVGANYDIGNSAALGYAPGEELSRIGCWVMNVHVKDRLRGGTTVPLGSGNADFEAAFAGLARAGYAGSFVLQTARRPGDDVAAAREYKCMTADWIGQAFGAAR